MLVLLCKSANNSLASEKNRFIRKRLFVNSDKYQSAGFERYSMTVNGKLCYVISAEKEFYLNENINGLLNAFCGRLVSSDRLYDVPCVKDNLFDIMPYYKKYAAAHFAGFLKSLCTSASDVAFYDRSGEYIKYMQPAFSRFKAFGFYTDSVYDYSGMINHCYNEFGFKPKFFGYNEPAFADIIANIDGVSAGGLLTVKVFNEPRIVSASYPRYKFNAEAMHLLQCGITRDYLTAAFYDNDF